MLKSITSDTVSSLFTSDFLLRCLCVITSASVNDTRKKVLKTLIICLKNSTKLVNPFFLPDHSGLHTNLSQSEPIL